MLTLIFYILNYYFDIIPLFHIPKINNNTIG